MMLSYNPYKVLVDISIDGSQLAEHSSDIFKACTSEFLVVLYL